jgi:hypothetical protein
MELLMRSFKEFIQEDGMGGGAMSAAPANITGSGQVAGMGQPPGSKSGEPGVTKKKRPILKGMFKRNPPKM